LNNSPSYEVKVPIKPENRAKYPKDWKEVRVRIMDRAQWQWDRSDETAWVSRCECKGECGLHRGRRCVEEHGYDAKWAKGKVVLTIAHLDHDPTSNDSANLRAMCQRCHLRYDMPLHRKNAAKTRREKRNVVEMFEVNHE
jgi:hypothetical protein